MAVEEIEQLGLQRCRADPRRSRERVVGIFEDDRRIRRVPDVLSATSFRADKPFDRDVAKLQAGPMISSRQCSQAFCRAVFSSRSRSCAQDRVCERAAFSAAGARVLPAPPVQPSSRRWHGSSGSKISESCAVRRPRPRPRPGSNASVAGVTAGSRPWPAADRCGSACAPASGARCRACRAPEACRCSRRC